MNTEEKFGSCHFTNEGCVSASILWKIASQICKALDAILYELHGGIFLKVKICVRSGIKTIIDVYLGLFEQYNTFMLLPYAIVNETKIP